MDWAEVFVVFLVSHLVGDFAIQTEWQARHKHGGLGPDPTARRALLAHVLTYTLVFVPAFVWLWDDLGAGVLALAALVFGTHLVQDDGRMLDRYVVYVKRTDPVRHPAVRLAVDQTFHVVVLFGLAVLVGA
ncbi:MAG TPA: DUF3307 domain-containing protein [Thermoleophilaceae bacterium]|jgi:hypothetical protein